MMQTNYLLVFIAATTMTVSALPISGPMAFALVDALKQYMSSNQGEPQYGPLSPPMPPPMTTLNRPPPGPAFMSPAPRTTMNTASTRDPNAGLLMNMPASNHIGGAPNQWGMGSPFNREYCPPGPQSLGNDACKEQKLLKALYRGNGLPRYDWVPPMNPWDTSIADSVKDRALHILTMKIRSRRNPVPNAQEWELMSILGDPKDPMFMFGGRRPRLG